MAGGRDHVGTRCCIWARDMDGLCKVAANRDAVRRGEDEEEDCRTLMTKLLFQLLSTVVNANFMQIFFGWRSTLKCHYGQ